MGLLVKNVSISIGKREILLNESVGIAGGSKVGLLGRNGAGKTTFLKAILGQVDYTGQIEYRGRAAYFSQHIDLDPEKTVRETLGENATIHRQNHFEKELAEIEKQLSDPATHLKDADFVNKLTE